MVTLGGADVKGVDRDARGNPPDEPVLPVVVDWRLDLADLGILAPFNNDHSILDCGAIKELIPRNFDLAK